MPWVYNYGELGPQQIEELLGFAPFCSLAASSPNSKIFFKGKSRKWASPVATLERCKGNWTYGSALLVPEDELKIFDKYHQNYSRTEVPILIDATKDRIKAISYVLDKESPMGIPSDDYVKSMLKHLKFFWDQGDGANLKLENFGIEISKEVEVKNLKKEIKSKTSEDEIVKNVFSDLEQLSVKAKSRKRTKA